MSFTNDDIAAKAKELLGGRLREGGEGVLESVCASASAMLRARLRAGVQAEELSELFVTAAGILAIAMYMELDSAAAADIASYSAGNFSVRLKDGCSAPELLRKRAEELLGAYIDRGGFGFMGVRG